MPLDALTHLHMHLGSSGMLTPLKTFCEKYANTCAQGDSLGGWHIRARVKKIELKRSWSRWSLSDRMHPVWRPDASGINDRTLAPWSDRTVKSYCFSVQSK